jgi:hypothetical protein
VEARKQRIAAQAELGATEAGDRLIEAIRSGAISGQGLIPAFGVCVDKMVALRGDVIQTIRHEHYHELRQTHEALRKSLLALHDRHTKPVQGTIVQTHLLEKKKRRKKDPRP